MNLPPNSILFVSDVHLSGHSPLLHDLFIHFLQGPARAAKRLYILGDLFDIWVGEDLNTDFQVSIQNELKALATQVECFFMAGNRDFLMASAFMETANIQVLKDPSVINLHGIPSLLTHGDTLCTQDIAYQRFRKVVRHPLIRWLFLSFPKKTRENMGKKLRAKSQRYQQQQDASILDVTPVAVEDIMKKHQVPQLIHGHVHRPKIHSLLLDGKKAKRIVLGDWYTQGSVIIATPDKLTLAEYDMATGLTPVAAYALEELAPLPA